MSSFVRIAVLYNYLVVCPKKASGVTHEVTSGLKGISVVFVAAQHIMIITHHKINISVFGTAAPHLGHVPRTSANRDSRIKLLPVAIVR